MKNHDQNEHNNQVNQTPATGSAHPASQPNINEPGKAAAPVEPKARYQPYPGINPSGSPIGTSKGSHRAGKGSIADVYTKSDVELRPSAHSSAKPVRTAPAAGRNMNRIILILVIVVGCIGLLLALWFLLLKDFIAVRSADPVSVTSVVSLMGLDSDIQTRYTGVVEPQKTLKVERDTSKIIAEVHVRIDDEVGAGDVLFTYDTKEMDLQLQELNLQLESINATIASYTSQISDLEAQKKNASEEDKLTILLNINTIELSIKEEEYNASKTKMEIEKMTDAIANADVVAEEGGVIQAINRDGAVDSTGAPLPFMTILTTGDYRVKGTATEQTLQHLNVDMPVLLRSRVDDIMTWKGVIESIDYENTESNGDGLAIGPYYGDFGTPSTRYNFYVTLTETEGLMLGQHLYIEPSDESDAPAREGLWLSSVYIVMNEELTEAFVWIRNEEGVLEKRPVTLGDYDEALDEYQIKSGLTLSDYIAMPKDDLKEGRKTTTATPGIGDVIDNAAESSAMMNPDVLNSDAQSSPDDSSGIDGYDDSYNSAYDDASSDDASSDVSEDPLQDTDNDAHAAGTSDVLKTHAHHLPKTGNNASFEESPDLEAS